MENSLPSSPSDSKSSGQMDPVEEIDEEGTEEHKETEGFQGVGDVSRFYCQWSQPWPGASQSCSKALVEETEGHKENKDIEQVRFISPFQSRWSQPWSKASQSCSKTLVEEIEEHKEGKESEEVEVPSFQCDWSPPWLKVSQPCSNSLVESYWPQNVENDNISVDVLTGAGFGNLGNTCFLNAVLQCFMHTVPLIDGVLSDEHLRFHNCIEEFCVICYLSNLAARSLDPINRVISPWNIVNNLSYFSSSFKRFQQEDAHEFLQCFLDKLETCHNSLQKHCMMKGSNIVQQIFGGCLVSKLKCSNCGHCSDTYEPLIDLSLEIGDADNLLMALESFTKVEKIDDEETKFTCEGCKEQVAIEKQLSFDQAPSVAAFHLKRFKNDGCLVEKIDKHVAFPLDLDLRPFTTSGQKDGEELGYALYAVVVHNGLTSTSGHYYCFIRLSPDVWCKFDDSRVTLVHEDFVLSKEGYILFYVKEGTPWFSSYIETLKVNGESKICNKSPVSVLENVCTSSSSPDRQKNIQCGSDEKTDAGESKEKGVIAAEIDDDGPLDDVIQGDESRDSQQRISIQAEQSLPKCPSAVLLPEAQKDISPRVEVKVEHREEKSAAKTRILRIPSPEVHREYPTSPEIYREDRPGFSIGRDHINGRESCKRKLEKEMDDLETKQAFSFIRRSLPSSRGHQLLAVLRDSRIEGSVTAKQKKRLKCKNSSKSKRRQWQ